MLCSPAMKSRMASPTYFQVNTTKTVPRARPGVPRKPCSGGVSPMARISPSTTPDSGWSSWYQTTPAITSATT